MRERLAIAVLFGGALGATGSACVGDGPTDDDATSSSSSSSSSGSAGLDATAPEIDASSSGNPSDGAAPEPDAAADGGVLADLPGLALWLEADDLARGEAFAAWSDRSPHHNDATSSAGSVPLVVGGNDSINGHNAVRFDAGQRLSILDSTSLQLPDEGFLIEAVERHPGIGDGQPDTPGVLFAKRAAGVGPALALLFTSSAQGPGTNPSYWRGDVAAGSAAQWPNPATLTLKVANDVPHLVSFRLTQSILAVRVDSNAADTKTITVPAGHGLAAIGANAYVGATLDGIPFRGDVAALVVVRAPGAVDVTRVDAYLRKRFGFPPAPP